MKTTKNTVLITGSSAGIGLAIAKQLTALGNHVIITGRNEENLAKAVAQLENVTAILFDVTDENDVNKLAARIEKDFPQLNILINNAGSASYGMLASGKESYQGAKDEMDTNYLSVIRLTDKLLPILSQQDEAAIVNVSSIVALVPGVNLPTYSASKAALHSYTQSLRLTLAKTNIKVFELMPPLVNTDFSQAIGGANGIPPEQVATDLVNAFSDDTYEIHVGQTAYMYDMLRKSPEEAFLAMNASRVAAE